MEPSNGQGTRWRVTRIFISLAAAGALAVGVATWALATPVISRVMFDELQIYPALQPPELSAQISGDPAAIVILTAGRRMNAVEFGEGGNQTLDGFALERTRYGAFIARKTGLPILVTGGIEIDGQTLADIMARSLTGDYGIAPKWVERKSVNTAENAMFSAAILKEAGITHILLVTHSWHMKRAVDAFTANGLSVTPAPTAFYFPGRDGTMNDFLPSDGTLRMSIYAIHEIVGGVWYRWKYGY